MILDDRRMRFLFQAWRSGSMRAAGDVLGVAPSSISRQIAQLEREVGARLIEHGRREIRLTAAGQAVIDHHRARLAGIEALRGQLQDLSSGRAGQVRLALGEGFLGEALYATLDGFMDAWPGFTLAVNVTDTPRMVQALLEDEVHFGLGFHPLSHPQIVSRFRAPVPLRAILHGAHPLAGRASLSVAELCAQPLALMGPDFRIRQTIDLAATDTGQVVAPVLTSNSIALLIRTACARRGVTVLPEFSVRAELSDGRLVAVPIDAPQFQTVHVHLIARRNRSFAPQLLALADQIGRRLVPATLA